MGKRITVKKDDKEANEDPNARELRRKRVMYMEMVTIVETVLQRENYKKFAEAIKNDKRNEYEAACDSAKIPINVRNKLWEILKDMWQASGNEAPWLTGIG
jgi:hypothetical protein